MFRMPASREFAINPDDERTVQRETKTRVGDRRISVVLIAKEMAGAAMAIAVAASVKRHVLLSE
jgi:hypothetical protein